MTNITAAVCTLILILTIGAMAGISLVVGQRRADAAADVAAVGGAVALQKLITGDDMARLASGGVGQWDPTDAGVACGVAGEVAAANGAQLDSCRVEGEEVWVGVSVGSRRADAHAGPAEWPTPPS